MTTPPQITARARTRRARRSLTVIRTALAAGAAVALLAGCAGAGSGPTPTASTAPSAHAPQTDAGSSASFPPTSPAPTPSAQSLAAGSSTLAKTTTRRVPADATEASAVVDLGDGPRVAVIVTPSGNIGCDLAEDASASGCGVLSWEETVPYGRQEETGMPRWWVSLTPGSVGQVVGKGDTALFMDPSFHAEVVGYGRTVTFGRTACTSEESGLTCWDTASGHGVTLSRDGREVF